MIPVIIIVIALVLICLLIGLPLFGFVLFYILSFNRRAVVIKEAGENVDDSLINTINCRVKNTQEGEVIQFFKSMILEPSKRYNSNLWTKKKEGKRFREAIILYEQSGSYRPTKIHWLENKVELHILDEDNRKFLIHREIMRGRKAADNKVYVTAITVGLIALVLICLMSVLTILYMNNVNMETIIKESVKQVING